MQINSYTSLCSLECDLRFRWVKGEPLYKLPPGHSCPRAEGNGWDNQIVSLGTKGFQIHGALALEVHKKFRCMFTGTQRQRIWKNVKFRKNEKAKGKYERQK